VATNQRQVSKLTADATYSWRQPQGLDLSDAASPHNQHWMTPAANRLRPLRRPAIAAEAARQSSALLPPLPTNAQLCPGKLSLLNDRLLEDGAQVPILLPCPPKPAGRLSNFPRPIVSTGIRLLPGLILRIYCTFSTPLYGLSMR
jgi:hypothetical protein